MATAIDVIVAATCRLGRTRVFDCANYRKTAKYRPVIEDGMIAKVVPFAISLFGVLAKPAKAFLRHVMDDAPKAKLAKARQRIVVATVRGTARLSYAWSACAALIVGGF